MENSRLERDKDSLRALADSLQRIVISKSTDSLMSAKEIFDSFASSTVTIVTPNGSGTGFYIDRDLVVTNYHVIENAPAVLFQPYQSEQKYPFRGYVAVDKLKDLAILQTEEFYGSPLILADSMINPGDPVFVIGNPLGLEASISDGIVSGLRQTEYGQYIQITAPISHGNSGGPVFNAKGEVIGVSEFYIDGGQNLNFAVPYQHINTMLNFKAAYAQSFSELIDDATEESGRIQKAGNNFGKNNSWSNDDRTLFVKECIAGDSEISSKIDAADRFTFCSCIFDFISDSFDKTDEIELTDDDRKFLFERCSGE